MSTAKESMRKILEHQPEDSSYDELLRELAFKRMIDAGLKDVDEGNTITNEEMKQKINTWLN